MSIPIQFVNLVIRRSSIDRVYPGGSSKFLSDYGPFDGIARASDDHLVKFGAMSASDIDEFIKPLKELGLKGLVENQGVLAWQDYCVIDELFGFSEICGWLTYNRRMRTASKFEERNES